MSAHTSILAESITYSIGAFALAIGTVISLLAWRLDDQDTVPYDDTGYAMLIAIPALAALAYTGMRVDLFAITTNGIQIQTLRYVDWAATTPLLVGYMAYAAQADRRTVVGVIVADLLMILLGFVAVLQTGLAVYVLAGLSTIAYFWLVYYLFGPLDQLVRDRGGADKWAVYAKLRNLIGFLWFAYPIVWVLSPPALQVLTRQTTGILITYMDVSAKLGFVLIATNTAGVFDSLLANDTDYDAELTTDGGRDTEE